MSEILINSGGMVSVGYVYDHPYYKYKIEIYDIETFSECETVALERAVEDIDLMIENLLRVRRELKRGTS